MIPSFMSIYNSIFSRKKLLCEKYFLNDEDDLWNNHFILEFNPFIEKTSEFLVKTSGKPFPVELMHWNHEEYCSFTIDVLDNVGNTDGSEFINWINSFYNKKNNYYNFNIYDDKSKDINIYSLNKKMKKISKFRLISCVIKEPKFYQYNKANSKYPQLTLTICTKNPINITHLLKTNNNN
jgi:hypothetical protein